MKITAIETFTQGSTVSFVRVCTDSGAQGFGQIAPYHADISAKVLHEMVARVYLGQDPERYAELSDRAVEANLKFPWSFVCRAVGGIDTAIWDLKGKVAEKSVCELLGGTPRMYRAYGSSMRRDITPKDEAARLVALRDQKGFEAFKIRIGSVCGHDKDQWEGRTETLVPEVRKSLGPDTKLFVDANSCYTAPKAIEIGGMLADNGVCHFEEPCPYWELEWTAQVTAALDIPVTGGEQDVDLAQWRRMIAMPAVDIVQPDICYVGGITRAMRVAAMARQTGLKCTPHSANRSLVTVFTLHMLGAVPNHGGFLEFSIEETPWTEGLFEPALKIEDGKVAIPEGPGWGVTLNMDRLEQMDYRKSEI